MRLLSDGLTIRAQISLVSATVPVAVAVVLLPAGVLLGGQSEHLRWSAVLGVVLVTAGVVVLIRRRARRAPR